MAAIREELILADRFSAALNGYMQKMTQANRATQTAYQGQRQISAAASQGSGAMNQLASSARQTADLMEHGASALREMAQNTRQAAQSQQSMNRAMERGQSTADRLGKRLWKLVSIAAMMKSALSFGQLADGFTQTTARLDRMNDGLQTTAQLQQMIYESAQRSRGSYWQTADTVAKLGTMAGDAFSSNAELVAFAEQLNKQFALAGTSTQGVEAAMLQLTQAMSSGALRGEELNSVLEQAPTVAQRIADYMGVSVGEMRQLASEGKVSAQVVKNALLSAADETNKAFEAIPLTFSQAWMMAKNAAIKAMEPAMQKLNQLLNSELGQKAFNSLIAGFQLLGQAAGGVIDLIAIGAQWFADNWDLIASVLTAAAGAAIGLGVAMLWAGRASALSALKTAAAWALAHWPLLLFIGLAAAVALAAQAMGMDIEQILSHIGAVIGWLYAFTYNIVAAVWNLIATFAEFFANVFDNPVAAIANLFLGLFNFIMDIVSNAAGAIDALFGSNLSSAVKKFQSGVNQHIKSIFGENQIKIQRMEQISYKETMADFAAFGGKIGRGISNFSISDALAGFSGGLPALDYANLGDMAGDLKGVGSDTSAIRRSVALAEEDIKLLADMAQHEYVNNINLTAQTPVITIHGQNTGDTEADLRWLEQSLKKLLIEQAASHTDLRYV